jgi:hypothetical protein
LEKEITQNDNDDFIHLVHCIAVGRQQQVVVDSQAAMDRAQ